MRLVNYGVDSAFRAGILFDHLVVDADAAAQAVGLVGIDTQARWTSLRQFFALDIDGLRRLDTAARALVAEQTMSEHVRLLTDVRLGPPILFLAPAGHQFEVFVPHVPESFQERESDGSGRRIGYLTTDALYNGPGVRPRRLGHALLKCERVEEMQNFLSNVLGFRLSDRALGGDIVWMRCSPDPSYPQSGSWP